ncbi:hypothetical protein PQ469_20825 [Mucilaginibacter sp. KACC 22773]|jgi:hypothetical protein|uniref:hypothetical protein n=1 Tax=Mucilaginibacter sp. KACC 22773 TaxID=3025671 RepID=UPI002366C1BF|nr:hypothetical protein [Mucilaginibacter sp. KACC 22773]WDF76336.1 hypothetical protein PQ469_20825 [Mucilaginibacter sp. KACC 22773]
MKDKKVKSAAKEARKALKKQLNDKFTVQLKNIVSEFEPDLKSLTKAIEKASKNLAKAIAAKISDKKDAPAAPAKKIKGIVVEVKAPALPIVKEAAAQAPVAKVAKTATKTAAPKPVANKKESEPAK